MLDKFDLAILEALQNNGRLTNQALAEQCNLSTTPCWRRVRKLEEEGYINRYTAILNPQMLQLTAIALVHVALIDHRVETLEAFDRFIADNPQIVECSSITGSYDYVFKVLAKDPQSLEQFLMEELLHLGIVQSTNTDFVLRQMKSTTALPLGAIETQQN